MKTIFQGISETLKEFWQIVALIISLLLVWILTGISIWFLLPIIFFFWIISKFDLSADAKKVLGFILRSIIVIALMISILAYIFPRTFGKNGKIELVERTMDSNMGRSMGDETEIKAKELWDIQHDSLGKKFIKYYDKLLARGQTQKAYDTLAKFQKAWDMEEVAKARLEKERLAQQRQQFITDSIKRAKEGEQKSTISRPAVKPANCIVLQPQNNPYFKLGPTEETDWLKLPSSNLADCHFFSDQDFFIVPDGEEPIKIIKGSKTPIPIDKLKEKQFKIRAASSSVLVEIRIS